ncbi:hypothetical protein LPJ66_009188 [Kickxella alabastrina]|uniref:Uncharacterized protein n=1 Tax=Kickxella alabastrina TaxID=61397 RepID=A0ACC1I886_9FUNG|nr:hypothetical protein LPJ66_009188 [Kickxella alabastrina]
MLGTDDEFLDEVCSGYPDDGYFRTVYHALMHPNNPVEKLLATKILQYEAADSLLYYTLDTNPQLCIPQIARLHSELIQHNHDVLIARHLAVDATLGWLWNFY